MPQAVPSVRRVSPAAAGAVLVLIAAALGGVVYLSRPTATTATQSSASADAKAYVRELELTDVSMSASESFMNQQLVEVQGNIANHGGRALRKVEVFCLFYNTQGREIHRERSIVIAAKGTPLSPGQTRRFRLPFDGLPDGWNQAVPRMVVADIDFAK